MAFKTDWKDYVPNADGLKYKLTQNDDGTYKIEDVTTYTVVGDKLTATQLNAICNALNLIESNIPTFKLAEYTYPQQEIQASARVEFEASFSAVGIPDSANVVSIQVLSTGWGGVVPQAWYAATSAKTINLDLYNATNAAHTVAPQIVVMYF